VLINRVIMLGRSARVAISTLLVVVAGAGMYAWMVSPHVSYLHAVQKCAPVVEDVAEEKRALCRILGAKRRRLGAMQAELSTLRAGLFTPEEARDFFANIESVCRKAGCSVTSVSFDSRSRKSRSGVSLDPVVILARRVDLTVMARYDQIVALLRDFQARPQRVHIDSCRIELVDFRRTELKCDLTMILWVINAGEDPDDG